MNTTLNLPEAGLPSQITPIEDLPPFIGPLPQPEAPRRLKSVPEAKTVLLADDDPGVREMLGRILEVEHYKVVHAKTGQEAMTRFLNAPPDLVLLDLNMPEKDGWEAFDVMCEKDAMVPVIVITARPGQLAQAVERGIDALMEKPLDLHLLLKTIRNLLAETEVERARRLTDPGFKTVLLKDKKERN